ncbi:fluoride efflux transporter CrcB [soil metagenome]
MDFLTHPATLIFLGGGTGAVLRYFVHQLLKDASVSFPWHTLLINILGSFALGILAVQCKPPSPWYLLLGIGVCGGFTTFSTFSLETVRMMQEGRHAAAFGYVTASVLAAVIGAWLGLQVTSSAA